MALPSATLTTSSRCPALCDDELLEDELLDALDLELDEWLDELELLELEDGELDDDDDCANGELELLELKLELLDEEADDWDELELLRD